jgi:hypothetical protein
MLFSWGIDPAKKKKKSEAHNLSMMIMCRTLIF